MYICICNSMRSKCRTVHTDFTLWTILAFKMRKWFPNIFESLYLHITSDLIERVCNWPLFNTKKIFFLLTFGHVLTILAWTKCRLVTKHVLSITHFHSCFFLTFPLKFYLYKKFKLSIKDYLLLIYTFMCMIIFLRILKWFSKVTKPVFLARV